ncbi:MAG: hypothetical protein J6Y82_08635 [Bacteroidales bacterium]|nr:hypothetical protein [Bacteroidales bacterium]
MKHILTTIALLIVAAITTPAQAPQGFSYQTVVRKANNALVANANISVTVSILQGSIDGDPVYSETHNTSTNTKGQFTITIGEKKPTAFSAIDWSTGVYFLKTASRYGTSVMQIVCVPSAQYAAKTDLSGENSKTDKDAKTANPSTQSTEKQSQMDLKKSTLKGKFSVSATEQVQFSQGNLQYQVSTGKWRFAEHQWDYVGDATNGNVYVGETKCNNALVSDNYDGWIDLFGWGTSGYNGKQPYMTSTESTDYSPVWSTAEGANNNLTGNNAQYDWGVYNAIANGGGKAGLWRCLTSDEWNYLLKTRKNALNKQGVACVNGVNGLILLPDDWKLPAGLKFNSGTHDHYGSQYYAQKNNYTLSEWSKMEAAGAVFLPAAGSRWGDSVRYVGSYGYYWSSSAFGESHVRNLYFVSDSLNARDWNVRHDGFSVRVVRTAVE